MVQKIGYTKIDQVSDYWKEKLLIHNSRISTRNIDLMGHLSKDAAGYESGHICGIHYERANMPSCNVMLNDLRS